LLKANTKELYLNSFKFEAVSHNDDTQNIMSDLDSAQTNLNANPDNRILLAKFIKVAESTAKELHSRYKEFWDEPHVN